MPQRLFGLVQDVLSAGFWLLPVVLVVAVVLLVVGARRAAARRTALQALAQQWGCRFFGGVDGSPRREWPRFPAFEAGDDRWFENTLAGTGEVAGARRQLAAGDFVWETSSTDSNGRRTTTTHHVSYLLVRLPAPTPGLDVRPEGFGDRMKAFFGFHDLEFESDEFNRAFHVAAGDRKFASDVLHPRAMEFLLANRQRRLALAGDALLVLGDGLWDAEGFVTARRFADGFLALWPRFLTAAT